MTVGLVAFHGCYGAAHGVRALEAALYRRRGLAPPRRGRGFGLLIAAVALLPSTYLGLHLAALSFGFEPPRLVESKLSFAIGYGFMTAFALVVLSICAMPSGLRRPSD